MSDKQSLLLNNSLKTPLFVCIMRLNVFWWLYLIKKKKSRMNRDSLNTRKRHNQWFISFYQNQLHHLKVHVNKDASFQYQSLHYQIYVSSQVRVSLYLWACMSVSVWHLFCIITKTLSFILSSILFNRQTFFHFSRTYALVNIWYFVYR